MQKYYAVKIGKLPGVYTTWNECKEQVNGFRGAKYKSFLIKKEANDFIGISQDKEISKPLNNNIKVSESIGVDSNLVVTGVVDGYGRALKLNDGVKCTVKGTDYYGALRYDNFHHTYYLYFEEHWSGYPFTKTPIFYYCSPEIVKKSTNSVF